jgi:hypothetical protein
MNIGPVNCPETSVNNYKHTMEATQKSEGLYFLSSESKQSSSFASNTNTSIHKRTHEEYLRRKWQMRLLLVILISSIRLPHMDEGLNTPVYPMYSGKT